MQRDTPAAGGIGDYVEKPKWMRKATYNRKLEEIFAAEEIVSLARYRPSFPRASRSSST